MCHQAEEEPGTRAVITPDDARQSANRRDVSGGGRGHLRRQVCQSAVLAARRPLRGAVSPLRPSITAPRQRGHRARPASRPGEEVSVGAGGGPGRGAEPGGDAARAGANGGQRLLAAAQEGRVVGALVAAVVVVRLPALTLPLPATAKDPDERLKTQNHFSPKPPQTSSSLM